MKKNLKTFANLISYHIFFLALLKFVDLIQIFTLVTDKFILNTIRVSLGEQGLFNNNFTQLNCLKIGYVYC